MELGAPYRAVRNRGVDIASKAFSAWSHIPNFLLFWLRSGLIWILDISAKPIYDLLERKVVTAEKKQEVDHAIEELKNADQSNVDAAIDNVP